MCVSSLALRGTKYFSAKGRKGDVVPFARSTFGTPDYTEISSYIQVRRSEREKVKLCSLVIAVVDGVVFVVVLLPQ